MNYRNIIKKLFLLIIYYILFLKIKKRKGLLILTYHRVVNEPDLLDPLKVSIHCFEKQIEYLKKNYVLITGEQLAEIIINNRTFPSNSCLITFDDGWGDNYTNAFPILQKYKVPAIIFLATDYIGTKKTFWYERLKNILEKLPNDITDNYIKNIICNYPTIISEKILSISKAPQNEQKYIFINELIEELKYYTQEKIDKFIDDLSKTIDGSIGELYSSTMLTWEQVVAMSKCNVTIGSHTKSHAILTQANNNQIMDELIGSKNIIEKKTGTIVNYFCYPNGNYNKLIADLVHRAGYIAAFTCLTDFNKSLDEPFELKRKHVLEMPSMNLNGEFSEMFFKIDLSEIRFYLQKIKNDIKKYYGL